jgi:TonB family protein
MPVSAGPLTPELQKAIRASTFEVVLKKPEKDPLSYEKPLPLELLPFSERTDAYNSVGTAFALGNNRYVTAAHVIQAGINSQFGAPMLRRSDGAVFEIDQILKYSQHQDFVLFSLKKDPAPAGFAVNESPQIDDVVLAVGNALGQGIVIRDGLYTSSTPEDRDGKWKWIRFSAAASPGNSGGPLLDDSGRVIGVVLAKSPNENLNYSLPITHVLTAPDNKALFEGRAPSRVPYLRATQTYTILDSFGLPQSWPAFERSYVAVMNKHERAAQSALLQANAQVLFPNGPGTESVLFDPQSNGFRPRLITQKQDNSWTADAPGYATTDLPGDGSVAVGTAAGVSLLRVVRPDAALDAAFYSDTKQVMDLVLKALDLRRSVGSDRVRITSVGAALMDTLQTDSYGRVWQERVYAVPFLNVYLGVWLLPTPDGYVGFVQLLGSAQRDLISERALRYANLFDVSLTGTAAQWRSYLSRRNPLPKSLASLQLDTGKTWAVRTSRFAFTAPPDMLSLSDVSVLQLTMGFHPEGTQTMWDVQGVQWAPDATAKTSLRLQRRMKPPATAKQALRTAYDDMRNRRPPYAGNTDRDSSSTWRMVRVVDVPAVQSGKTAADVLYTVALRTDSAARFANTSLVGGQIADTLKVLEKGQADDSAPAVAVAAVATQTSAKVSAAAFNERADRLLARLTMQPPPDITDNRKRKFADDLRDLVATKRKELESEGSDPGQMETEMSRQTRVLVAYWTTVRATNSNRELWPGFLARNELPADTPHGPQVMAAERALLEAQAKSPVPQQDWATLSLQLSRAYAQERFAWRAKETVADSSFRQRATPCPPPATTTAQRSTPAVDREQPSALEFYPPSDKRNGLEGAVIIAVKVSETGCAERMAVAVSSGTDSFDDAAIRYAETLKYLPAAQGNTPTAGQLMFRVKFELRD